MPSIKLDSLNAHHNEFLRKVRRALSEKRDLREALESVREAQKEYQQWFKERGIDLILPPEG